jgi:hypothetical protein
VAIEARNGPEAMTWHVAVAGWRGAIVVPEYKKCCDFKNKNVNEQLTT